MLYTKGYTIKQKRTQQVPQAMARDPTIYEYDEVHDNIEDDSVVAKLYMQE